MLTTLISDVCALCNIALNQLDAIAVSKGPGSYTGLRVGVSTAKGLCYTLGLPLIAINTLESLAFHFVEVQKDLPNHFLVAPMIDARRMEVYTAVFNENLEDVIPTQARIIDGQSFAEELNTAPVYFIGNGAAKCEGVILHPNARFVRGIVCSASGMRKSALKAFRSSAFEDVAYFEPFYLKDFVGTTPRKKIGL